MATKTDAEAAVTPKNTTPCPDWCTADHEIHSLHRAVMATKPSRKPLDTGEVALVDIRSDDPTDHLYEAAIHTFGSEMAYIPGREAAHLADVLESVKGPAWMVTGLRAAAALYWRLTARCDKPAEHWANSVTATTGEPFARRCFCSTGRDHDVDGSTYDLGDSEGSNDG